MIVGFMVHQWTEAIAATDVRAPQTKAELILTLLWDTICEPLWKMRNSINNSKDSHVEVDDMATMADRLRWYQRNQERVLDYRHRILCTYTDKDIQKWTRATRRARLEMLNNARKYYATECQQKQAGQSTIYNWLHSYKELRSGRLIGPSLKHAWIPGRQPPQTKQVSYDSDSSDEFEFDWEPGGSNT